MAVSFILELGIKVAIALLFVLINAVILRFVVTKLFRIYDDSFTTPMAVVIWISIALLIASYIPSLQILGWILMLLANYFFVYLVKKEYYTEWQKAFLIWLTWFAIFIAIGLVFIILWLIIFY